MAQTLKDDVKARIIESAKEEFLENSYEKTSMRAIASKSNITVGNLYRYFKSKEELNRFIVGPALNKLQTLILKLSGNSIDILEDREIVLSREELRGMLDTLGDGLVDIYNDHKIEVNILMMRSSINRNLTEWFSNALAQIFSSNYGVDINSRELHLLADSYAESIFSGIRVMLRNNRFDSDTLKTLVKIYLESYVDMLDIDFLKDLRGE